MKIIDLVKEYVGKFIQYIPKNTGAIVGIVQTVVAFIGEVVMLFGRLICPIIPGDADEAVVAKIKVGVNVVNGVLEKIKNWLLNFLGN